MEPLEDFVEKNFILKLKFDNFQNLTFLLKKDYFGHIGYTAKDQSISLGNFLHEFQEECGISMPVFHDDNLNSFLEKYLKEGYVLENSSIGTELTFAYSKKTREYYIGLMLQPDALKTFKEKNKSSNILPEITSGRSGASLEQAYFDLQNSINYINF